MVIICICGVLSSLGSKDLKRGVNMEMVGGEESFRPMSINESERRYINMYHRSWKRRACGRALEERKAKMSCEAEVAVIVGWCSHFKRIKTRQSRVALPTTLAMSSLAHSGRTLLGDKL